ncbi:ephexin-1-like isoform X1 [Thrips palmi]|uniref:Ephexin-1-like isoform X1 n=2 Tax=Thrips palmi TaxID=161013 RepID=A0A6P8ZT11_THRPL|nr:ephexin-1-like isoform X1 [Thrips palmi]
MSIGGYVNQGSLNGSHRSLGHTYRRPRPPCADQVFVSSASTTYFPWNPAYDLTANNSYTNTNGHVQNSPVQYVPVSLRTVLYSDKKEEFQEISLFLEKEGDVSTDSDNENPYESLYENPDAIDDIDSFDSDSDEDLHHNVHSTSTQGIPNTHNGKLPEIPPRENIYGVHVMRFKEAAGKKMQKLRKNWSLRKNDISNKLSRMRRKSSVDPRGATILSAHQTSPPHSPTMEKCQSSGQLTGNKYWSFKSKFKRSQSSTASLGSTFYLTEEVVVGNESSSSASQMDSNSTYADSASPASQRSGPPLSAPTIPLPPRPSSAASQQNATNERRNSGAMRPHSPPPPPPPVPKRNGPQKDKAKSNSSWYAECGLFDSSNLDLHKRSPKEDPFNTSLLYAEAGLWDNIPSNSSPYDSSQSEHDNSHTTDLSDSSAGHGSLMSHPLFSDEPLYQFYNASIFEQAKRQEAAEGDSDGYEEIVDGIVKSSRPSAMELIRPREGQHRTLWCEIPEVRDSGVLDSLSAHEKKLQEAKFELITSEASYVKSLNVLEKHFMNSPQFRDETVLSKGDRQILFSRVNPVRARSEKFLADMERCWQDSIMLQGICDIVKRHASEYFNVYTKYCTNQIYLDRTLKKLREGDSRFSEALLHLESSPECQSLSFHSFLMLPMQRICRLPLLLVAVLNRLEPEHDEYHSCELALASLNKVVAECNEGARKMERYEEMMLLSRQLEFPQNIKPVPIISSARWLVRSGALTQLIWRNDDAKLTFGRKVNKISVHLFLFTDILVVTKRKRSVESKSDETFCVVDYCPRNLVQMSSMEDLPQPQQLQLQPPLKGGVEGRHLVLLTMLQNQENKTMEMVLSCGSESDRERWLGAVSPPKSEDPNEQLYEMWDCPQVRSEHPYTAQQPDELSLDVGDVVNVLRKTKDGWYEGERIRDREKGWFPANYTVEIASAHIRAKNLKQRYRLLVLSGSYLQESRSKNK